MEDDTLLFTKPRLSVLSPEGVKRVHEATLDLLEATGVWLDESEALELLAGAGAKVSRAGWVKIPSELVEQAIARAPCRVDLYTRSGELAMGLEGDASYFGLAADGPNFLDPESGARRQFLLDDVTTMCRVANGLDSITFVEQGGLAADVPVGLADRLVFKEIVTQTLKSIGFCCSDSNALLDILQMASLVVGGEQELQRRPFIWHHAEPISPLRLTADLLKRVLICAEKRIPVGFMPMAEAGSTAPVTLAGTLVQASAETLSGLVIHQLKNPGAPFIIGGMPGVMDMRSMVVSYAAPELDLMSAALAQMAQEYHLPFLTSAGASDAKDVDEQAAVEAALSCLIMAWSGANLIIDTGMLDHSELISPELVVLVDEVLRMVRQLERGIRLDADSLALWVVAECAGEGNFLAHSHTLHHFQEVWYPQLFDRSLKPDLPVREFRHRLRERTRNVLVEHEPMEQPLQAELAEMARSWVDQ